MGGWGGGGAVYRQHIEVVRRWRRAPEADKYVEVISRPPRLDTGAAAAASLPPQTPLGPELHELLDSVVHQSCAVLGMIKYKTI